MNHFTINSTSAEDRVVTNDVLSIDRRVCATKPRAAVLIVDDMARNLLALEAVLDPLHCDVVRARSGQEALEQIKTREFAVVLMDVMMPDLDGISTTGLIRQDSRQKHVPVIFLTALDAAVGDRARGYAEGAVDYLVKPVDPDVLRAKVAVFVELFVKCQELKAQTALAQRREREALESRRMYEKERGARAHAEAIARAREDILAVVSHDLRNPMSAIATSTSMLKRKLATGQIDGAVARVETIERSVARMESLVSDLLDTARIQSGGFTVRLQDEDVAVILCEIADQVRPVLAKKGQRLEVCLADDLPPARCDRERVFQVFSNLLGNASKFSGHGCEVRIDARRESDEILFTVRDQGVGITPDHLRHVFEPYWQASQQRTQGLGLGLAIVKGVIDAHRSRIWVESTPNVGSMVHFTLPIANSVNRDIAAELGS